MISRCAIDELCTVVPQRHFWNTVALTLEFCFNRLTLRAAHVFLFLSWPLLYMLFTWLRKASVADAEWPYGFLALDDAWSLVWYAGLIMFNLLLFSAFVRVSRCKRPRVGGLPTGCAPSHNSTQLCVDVQEPLALLTSSSNTVPT